MTDQTPKPLLFIELNEFNEELLQKLSKEFDYKNIQKLLSLPKTTTYTADVYESDYLEPWVQWVSVHTGVDSKKHQIKHLGDVPSLSDPQVWEKLSQKGISSGIWGAMNASKGSAEHCKFFLPDPWTFSEQAHPSELSPLLDLLRYSARNYLKSSKIELIKKILQTLKLLKNKKVLKPFLKELKNLLKSTAQFKGEAFSFISLFDYLSTLLFIEMVDEHQPHFNLIFLNSLAHMQHHHWDPSREGFLERYRYGLSYLDRVLGLLFKRFESTHTLYIANALSQMNTNHEKPWVLYRQKDQTSFLETIGARFSKVQPHMTHDAHIFFDNLEDKKYTLNLLKSASILNQPLFMIEEYEKEPLKIFYKIGFTDEIGSEEHFVIGKSPYRFFNLFSSVIKRTGRHVQKATLFSSSPIDKGEMMNHEIAHLIEAYFDVGVEEIKQDSLLPTL